jgi:ParB-like chromosome segregation protein Spo0J
MEVENIKIDELKPYKNNPRLNDDAVEYVAESIKQFGFKVPIVIDKNNVIVTGHTRLKASKQLGLKEGPDKGF